MPRILAQDLDPDGVSPTRWAVLRCATVIVVLLLSVPALAQVPGSASFVVYENGRQTGTLQTTVTRSDDGWRVQGSMRTTGAVPVTIANLDLLYDQRWFARFMTMEMKAPDDVIVHVAVVGARTRTDTVRATEARFRSNSVSPNTIFLPDHAYGAYEAVAARLAGAASGDLPLFIAPRGETRATVDVVTTEQVRTANGAIRAQHYVLTEIRDRPTRVDVWVAAGRLLRVDVPRAQLSVVRQDVRR